jgi:restriction system protein
MSAHCSPLRTVYNSRGWASYEIELSHDGLHKHHIIKGNDPDFVQRKAAVQLADWQEQWSRRLAVQDRLNQTNQKKRIQDEQKLFAAERSREAQEIIESLRNTLNHTLDRDDTIDWDRLKDSSPFPKPKPTKPKLPQPPTPIAIPQEPLKTDPRYQLQLGLLDKLFASRREQKLSDAAHLFNREHQQWEQYKHSTILANEEQQRQYEQLVRDAEESYRNQLKSWEKEQAEFLKKQEEQNAAVDQQKEWYLSGSPDAIAAYCDMVLSNSEYPDFLPQEYELDYNPETRILVVDYSLPAPENIPTLVEVKYIASRDEFTEKYMSESQSSKLYDDLLYQLTLRTIHELFEADVINALATIVLNGYVCSIDKGTGQEAIACVLSIQARRDEFMSVNLANVDPKVCFKQMKGIGSSKLHSVTAVAPIVSMRRDDGRFVSSYDVAHHLNEGYNLAAMDWEDFEHLIREIFAKEFSSAGGEVKVTQASRDGGVDAIAFDPDPIRGGKIVIQAKRYTNTVGVAAVRDLYGTVLNEGATKGILVTTSDYGPDAYEFVRNKPLTLLSGANLLHLLEKHGHKARIDLHEARKLAMEQKVKGSNS